MPRWSASLRSPVFHFPPLTNCTTPTRQPRAHPRDITPKAAEDFPFPCPVLRRTTESARVTPVEATAFGGGRVRPHGRQVRLPSASPHGRQVKLPSATMAS